MILQDYRDHVLFNSGTAAIFGILLLWISSLLLPGTAFATTIYSYVDDRGTPVMTDNFENIPERYRAKVRVTEQAPKGASDHSVAVELQQQINGLTHNIGTDFDKFVPAMYGLTHYQSKVLSFGGIAVVLCLLARLLGRGQVVRFLSLWCLIMLGLSVPALFFTSQDAPLDRLTGQAGSIQEKQQKHLQGAS
jgi:hypothetical protein